MSTISFNGSEYSEQSFVQASEYVMGNTAYNDSTHIRTPAEVARVFGKQYDGDRDVFEVLGYPDEPEIEDYRAKYERNDIAQRIVSMPAQDTWRHPPDIFDSDDDDETAFQNDLEQLTQQTRPWQNIRRADTIAGIGEFGVLFIGVREELDEGEEVDLSSPLEPDSLDSPEDITHYQPLAQDSIEEWDIGKEVGLDPSDPMYNKPVIYHLDFSTLDESEEDITRVHHSRLLHIPAGLRGESDVKADPRLQSIFNRLIDLEKVVGSSAEMFWAGADRKFHFNIDSQNATDIPDSELDTMDDEVQKLVHDMQSHLKTFNTNLEVIEGDDPDPTGIVDSLLKFISGATGIPLRLLVGSERGELASSQDRANWFGQVETRQNTFAEPVIIRPFIDKMIDLGVLSDPQDGTYDVEWKNLFELTELEQAEVHSTRSEVIRNISGVALTPEQTFDYVVDGTKPEFDGPQAPQPFPDDQELMDLMPDSEQPEVPENGQSPDQEEEQDQEMSGNFLQFG